MKTFSLTTALILLVGGQTARADHRFYRHLDEHVVDALADARDLHWTLREKFDQSRDYRTLLRDADQVLGALREVEDAVLSEARISEIHRLVDITHDRLMELDRRLGGCDFAVSRGGGFSYRNNGYSFRPATRHPGYVHVQTLRRLVAELDRELDTLHDEVEPGFRRTGPRLPVSHHDHHDDYYTGYTFPVGKTAGIVVKIGK